MRAERAKRRGRPPGRTAQGASSEEAIFQAAVELIAERGYEAATMREIAARCGVSPALAYKYFPSKSALVMRLYDDLSAAYAARAAAMPSGAWRDRALFAMQASLQTLAPRRDVLRALTPILVGDPRQGLFAAETSFSRRRVEQVFLDAVAGAGRSSRAA